MNKEEENERNKRNDLAIKRLVTIFNHSNLSPDDTRDVITGFLYSVGAALLKDPPRTYDEVLLRYASEPTFGSALMAQAAQMKETWVERKDGRKETNEHDIRRNTETREGSTTIQDIQGDNGSIRSDENNDEETMVK